MQFQDVGATDGAASIAKLTSTGLKAGSYDTMNKEAPSIQIYNGRAYDFYFYISDAYDADGNEVTAWADTNGDETDVAEFVGTGFWLKVPEGSCSTGTLIQSGEVKNTNVATINIAAGLTLAGNPFPTPFDMSKVITEGLEPGIYDTMNKEAPSIQIYNGRAYDFYFYISDAYDADGNEVTAWADTNGDAITGVIAQTGEAFWVKSTTEGTLTFTK